MAAGIPGVGGFKDELVSGGQRERQLPGAPAIELAASPRQVAQIFKGRRRPQRRQVSAKFSRCLIAHS
jgi:hypothetical protein